MIDFTKLDSMTKYPSMPNYHSMENQKMLKVPVEIAVDFIGESVFLFEKIDGMNMRLIFGFDGMVYLGTRDRLVFGPVHYTKLCDCYMHNYNVEIFKLLILPHLESIYQFMRNVKIIMQTGPSFIVMYFELYGSEIGDQSKNYSTDTSKKAIALLDIAWVEDEPKVLAMKLESLRSWRDRGGQTYLGIYNVYRMAEQIGLSCPPQLTKEPMANFRIDSIHDAFNLIKAWSGLTRVNLDGKEGKSEGIIVRNEDRTKIAKLRIDEYRYTIQKRFENASNLIESGTKTA